MSWDFLNRPENYRLAETPEDIAVLDVPPRQQQRYGEPGNELEDHVFDCVGCGQTRPATEGAAEDMLLSVVCDHCMSRTRRALVMTAHAIRRGAR